MARALAPTCAPAQRRALPCYRHPYTHLHKIGIHCSSIDAIHSRGNTTLRHVQCRAESNSTADNGIDERVKAVAHKLLQKEEELKFITSPGRIPPKASVVAALRNDIAALRNQLSDPSSNYLPRTVTSPAKTVETKKKKSQALKTSGRKVQAPSSARKALLMVEEKLSATTRGASSAQSAPVSDKVKQALEMIEHNMSSMTDASKNLNEFETLQVENAVLRTKLEITLEKKRRLEQLHQAYQMGHFAKKHQDTIEMNTSSKGSKERVETKDLNVVYSL
mmetsp:Transcript_4214/g.8447  ORF Transcript_4214/g.8447 Transcript_4214/m.8447 type:complete len:278 (+) Transcript_4214:67-900(+)